MGGEIMEEWLEFRPRVSVGFRMSNKDEDWPSAYHHMLRATSAVLERLPDDAALVLNFDTGILIRRGGHVILTDEPRTFYPEALAEIRVPYEFGRVPTTADAP